MVPGPLKSADFAGLFVPAGARLVDIPIRDGQTVTQDEPLFVFDAPDGAAIGFQW